MQSEVRVSPEGKEAPTNAHSLLIPAAAPHPRPVPLRPRLRQRPYQSLRALGRNYVVGKDIASYQK